MTPDAKYERVRKELLARILSGEFESGKLPPLPKLAEEHDVSLMTASRAVKLLEKDGVVSCGPGSVGTLIDMVKARLKSAESGKNYIWADESMRYIDNVTLRYMASDYQDVAKDMWDGIAADFSAEYPWIKIEFYQERFSGFPPRGYDVFQTASRDLRNYAARGAALDLSPFMRAHTDAAGYFTEAALRFGTTESGVYGLPMLMNFPALFFNRKTVSRPPAGWHEFQRLSKELLAKGKFTAVAIGLLSFLMHWTDDIKKEFSSPDDSAALESALVFLKELYTASPELNGFGDPQKVVSGFLRGEVAMLCGYTSLLKDVAGTPGLEFGMAPMPLADRAPDELLTEVVLNSVSSECASPADAWLFVKYLASPPAQRLIARRNHAVPAGRRILENESSLCHSELGSVLEGRLSRLRPMPFSTKTMRSAYSRGYIAAEKHFNNEISLKVAARLMKEKMNEIFLLDDMI